jgi:hypothetical protein
LRPHRTWTELATAFRNHAARLKRHNEQGLGSDDYPGPWRVAAVVPIAGGRDAAQQLEAAWKAVGKQWDARLSATLDPRDLEGGVFAPPAGALWGRLPGVLRRLQQLCVLAADPEHAAVMRDVKLTWTPNQVLLLEEGVVVKAQRGLKDTTDDAEEDSSVTAALASLPRGVLPERQQLGLTPRAYKGFIALHVRPSLPSPSRLVLWSSPTPQLTGVACALLNVLVKGSFAARLEALHSAFGSSSAC